MINLIRLFELLAFVFLLTTASLGILLVKGKPVFIYHRASALMTVLLYSLHLSFIYLIK